MKHFIFLSVFVALSHAQFSTTEGPSQIIGVAGPRWRGPLANHILGQPVGDTPEVAAEKAAHYKAHAQILEILPVLPAEEIYRAVNVIQPQQQSQVNIPQQSSFVLQQPSQVSQQTYVPEVKVTAVPSSNQVPVVQQPVQTTPQFIRFAEEIPRSELGEVPEVAAARKAHLAAYAEIEKLLPKLGETTTTAPVVQHPQVVGQFQILNQQPSQVSQQTYLPEAQVVIPSSNQVPVVQQPVQTTPQLFQSAEEIPRSELGEVPEVAAARKAHLAAYAEIEKLLPKLGETTTTAPVVQHPQVVGQFQILNQQPSQVPQQTYVPEVQVVIPSSNQVPVVQQPVQTTPQLFQFAEDIPRSELGEVPEVAAARKAHLAAYAEIEKLLPKLGETSTTAPVVQHPQVVGQYQILNQQPQVVNQQPQVVYQQPQVVNQQPQVVYQEPQVVYQEPQVVYQQPRLFAPETQVVDQQSQDVNQQNQLWKQQVQRNLEWFYNPQQFYTYVPQDTPEVAAAKIEHFKLLQGLN